MTNSVRAHIQPNNGHYYLTDYGVQIRAEELCAYVQKFTTFSDRLRYQCLLVNPLKLEVHQNSI